MASQSHEPNMAVEHVGKDIGQDSVKVKIDSQTKDTGFESQCPESTCIHQSRDNLTPYLLLFDMYLKSLWRKVC